jgi:hypothetical protein
MFSSFVLVASGLWVDANSIVAFSIENTEGGFLACFIHTLGGGKHPAVSVHVEDGEDAHAAATKIMQSIIAKIAAHRST